MDDLEKTMRFIVDQQAQFTVDIQKLRETQAEFAKEFGADLRQVREVLSTHSGAIVTVVNMIGRLGEAQATAEGRLTTLETKMAELATAGKETENRLSAFIVFVEKYISSHNGNSQTS